MEDELHTMSLLGGEAQTTLEDTDRDGRKEPMMVVSWKLQLRCDGCSALITYVNRAPDWQIEEEAHPEEILAAKQWLVRYWKAVQTVSPSAARVQAGVMPTFVSYAPMLEHPHLATSTTVRYILCPNCGEAVYSHQVVTE